MDPNFSLPTAPSRRATDSPNTHHINTQASHLAAIALEPLGTVVAVEADSLREKLLRANLRRQLCFSVRVVGKDWLQVTPEEQGGLLAKAEAVLVNPSCSNSGTLADARSVVPSGRLQRLAGFQTRALAHSLRLPRVRRVVYSTCSVHAEENEAVVAAVLKEFPDWALEDALPGWHRRGIACEGLPENLARLCVRVDPLLDQAHGFFVACLVRT